MIIVGRGLCVIGVRTVIIITVEGIFFSGCVWSVVDFCGGGWSGDENDYDREGN